MGGSGKCARPRPHVLVLHSRQGHTPRTKSGLFPACFASAAPLRSHSSSGSDCPDVHTGGWSSSKGGCGKKRKKGKILCKTGSCPQARLCTPGRTLFSRREKRTRSTLPTAMLLRVGEKRLKCQQEKGLLKGFLLKYGLASVKLDGWIGHGH
eukprot:1150190-Pelagomonas_calceolata.AAC.11